MSSSKRSSRLSFSIFFVASALVAAPVGSSLAPQVAQAYGYWRGRGRWYHGYHGGRMGWWWIKAGSWYWYTRPSYPYPVYAPPPVIVQQQPPVVIQQAPVQLAPPATMPLPTVPPGYTGGSYYYCDQARAYYPYVATCPGGWTPVPMNPAN